MEGELYRCLNCGFIFKRPVVKWVPRSLNPGKAWAIAPDAMYVPVEVCPKCGSDAIRKLPKFAGRPLTTDGAFVG